MLRSITSDLGIGVNVKIYIGIAVQKKCPFLFIMHYVWLFMEFLYNAKILLIKGNNQKGALEGAQLLGLSY